MIDHRKTVLLEDLVPTPEPQENLEAEAEQLADEILSELNLGPNKEVPMNATSRAISLGPPNGDILSDNELDIEKVARFRRLVRAGEYKVNVPALAEALLASGDLAT